MNIRTRWCHLAWAGVFLAGCRLPIAETAPMPLSIAITPPAQWTVPVGQSLTLHATSSGPPPITWRIADEDREKSAIQAPADPGGTSIVSIRALQPGGVRVLATVDGQAAEALIGNLDPTTSSTPMPAPSGYPAQASGIPTGARLVTDVAAWDALVAEVRVVRPDLPAPLSPPVDLSTQSLVVVIADSNVGIPVVTHIERHAGTAVHVVHTRVQGHNLGESAGYMPGIITMLPIPKVGSDASVNVRQLPRPRL